ncbi:MAG: type II secretion system F family protein [Armatimonadota bacterium]
MTNLRCGTDMLQFWELLAEGVCAGRQLIVILDEIRAALQQESMGDVCAFLIEGLISGMSLSDSMRRCPKVFSKAHICLVEGGELVGRLDLLLTLIVDLTRECPTCSNLCIQGELQ